MHAHQMYWTKVEDPGPAPLAAGLKMGAMALAVVGAVIWGASVFANGQRGWQALLHSYFFFTMLGLGGVVFTAVQYVASARWSVVVRRIAEGMGAFIPAGLLVFLVIAIGGFDSLYAHTRESEGWTFDHSKAVYLSQAAVIAKGIVFYAVWFALARMIRGNSIAQDKSKDPALSKKNIRLSIAFLMLFAYTFTLHCVDMLMALEPKWFSTMFGVYCFCGLFLSSMCVVALITLSMRKRPVLEEAIQHRHLYDLGTWIMAFSCFMCYVGFSQYMLIWYANLPEETFYMIQRTQNGWESVTLLLPLLKWIIPFLVLMPQAFRGNPAVLTLVCCAVLVGQWIDLYWIIYPVFSKEHPVVPGLAEIGAFIALLGVFAVCLDWAYRSNPILPIGDPQLLSSVNGSYV